MSDRDQILKYLHQQSIDYDTVTFVASVSGVLDIDITYRIVDVDGLERIVGRRIRIDRAEQRHRRLFRSRTLRRLSSAPDLVAAGGPEPAADGSLVCDCC